MKHSVLELALDPTLIMKAQGMEPDPWQSELLYSSQGRIILNCCRQSGKSTTTASMAVHCALTKPDSLVLILAKSQRQAGETLRKCIDAINALDRPVSVKAESALRIEFENGSRIICLPGKEDTVRGFSKVTLLIIDEASRVPDDLYRSVRPMVAVGGGRIVLLSTPFGKRGFYYNEWDRGEGWWRIKISANDCPRITKEFLSSERWSMGDSWYNQEYFNSFESVQGLVYPDFNKAIIHEWPMPRGRPVGGIDWGFSDPFSAHWGIYDAFTDTIWIGDERYERYRTLHSHISALPKGVSWKADPRGRTEIEEFRAAGFSIEKADNSIRAGIAAVTARLQTGRLKILDKCIHAIEESQLYRYDEKGGEKPIDDNNHAMDGIRYLVAGIDRHYMARWRKIKDPGDAKHIKLQPKTKPVDPWMRLYKNPDVWKILR